MNALPWLTDVEVNDLCAPLRRSDAQVRYLQSLGLVVHRKANGRPLVTRAHFESVMAGMKPGAAGTSAGPTPERSPNVAGLLLHFGRKPQPC